MLFSYKKNINLTSKKNPSLASKEEHSLTSQQEHPIASKEQRIWHPRRSVPWQPRRSPPWYPSKSTSQHLKKSIRWHSRKKAPSIKEEGFPLSSKTPSKFIHQIVNVHRCQMFKVRVTWVPSLSKIKYLSTEAPLTLDLSQRHTLLS